MEENMKKYKNTKIQKKIKTNKSLGYTQFYQLAP